MKFVGSQFHFTEKTTHWRVTFVGKHGDLTAKLYKDGELLATYTCPGGHACKTKAAGIIKKFKNNQLKQQP